MTTTTAAANGPTAATGTTGTAGTTTQGATASLAKANEEAGERFLKLLMTQIQNQDPLNPMDNAQLTTQMAQINTVAGIEKLNTSMSAMTDKLSAQLLQSQTLQGATDRKSVV